MLNFSKCSILVIGDAMLDSFIDADVMRVSPEAPVPVAMLKDKRSVPGGAANVAMNLAALGCHAALAGVRGDDSASGTLQSILWKKGVDSFLLEVPDRPTTVKTRIISRGQQMMRLDREDSSLLSKDDADKLWEKIERQNLSRFSCVILSDYSKGVLRSRGEDGVPIAQKAIRACRELDIPVLVDPKTANWSIYEGATCVTPNTYEIMEKERLKDGRMQSLCVGAESIFRQLGLKRLLVTRSEKGCALFENGKVDSPLLLAGRPREVADVSGAGDTVIAVLAACLSSGMEWDDAARLANLAGGLSVEKLGTATVSIEELREAAAVKDVQGTLADLGRKICPAGSLKSLAAHWRRNGETIVFTNGCFDLLHMGHVKLIAEAAALGSRLVVAVNSDASVRRLKGPTRPVQNEEARAAVMAALDGVDAVCIFEEDTPIKLIEALKPDVLVKGGDYAPEAVIGADMLPQWGGRVHLVARVPEYSTTGIVEKITS